MLNSALTAPVDTNFENPDGTRCYEYTISVRNTAQKLQDPDVVRYILAKPDKKALHDEWTLSANQEKCKGAMLL